ncbi:exopolysaccharide biosynthesis polyprenyl glycosylphosphotransferase [Phaeocystidibacter marisrubri]|uniref:Exopolysaccharide biosynthesis polyprenyl glycosylphosphotransferase n=1 Tax=Phaeocystidibacter marisrubri TaxID=1577780 RepID=A0A6L3ZHU4_9FLAO|nr:exopolysaccharide biosynthesis polyprenyl glycosylphosphotransferase [Phaeocystidibacter marisrubri]KAB2817055.1 exopolysaccharide biosynthesis polyprenyl glycosylphosphotransferase [Phaeocystidibacter marisrubri]GGH77039.1 undecaprenyl-phosphate glucose phosphotransferase [Phaeocystidibacter marisrubri]
MNDRSDKLLRILQWLGDLVLLNASFAVSAWLRFDDLRVENEEYYNYYIQLLVFFNLSWSLIGVGLGIYNLRPGTEIRTALGRAMNALAAHGILFAILAVSLKGEYYSRLFLIYFYSSFTMGILIFRGVFISFWRSWQKKGKYARSVWLVGNGNAIADFQKELDHHPEYGYRVITSPKTPEEAAEMLASGVRPAEMYVSLLRGDESIDQWYVLAEQEGIRFRFLPDLKWTNIRHARVDLMGEIPVLIPRKEPLGYWHSRVIKRTFDIVFSTIIVLGVLSWFLPLLAVIIRLDSKGNPFFGQVRSGLNGEEFTCLKLRTMVVNHGDESVQASAQDTRITRVGRFLRKHNLDELPQFINVLLGQMSIVGPRPHMIAHTESYRHKVEAFMVRHWVKPGITGMAQVMGYRGETKEDTDMSDRVNADVYYLEHWSLLLDVKIFFWTIWNMVTGRKSGV